MPRTWYLCALLFIAFKYNNIPKISRNLITGPCLPCFRKQVKLQSLKKMLWKDFFEASLAGLCNGRGLGYQVLYELSFFYPISSINQKMWACWSQSPRCQRENYSTAISAGKIQLPSVLESQIWFYSSTPKTTRCHLCQARDCRQCTCTIPHKHPRNLFPIWLRWPPRTTLWDPSDWHISSTMRCMCLWGPHRPTYDEDPNFH